MHENQDRPSETQYAEFEGFYRAEIASLIGLLQRKGASGAEAEDAAQEAMEKILLKWSTLTNPRAYARKVALRNLWRGWRRNGRAVALEEELDQIVGYSGDEFDADTRYVFSLLSGLSPKQGAVMALVFDGFAQEEIAEIVGQPEATVRSNLRHARRKLAQLLDIDALSESTRKEVEQWTRPTKSPS